MKFLCLHGMGANSDVYETQLSSIIAQLGSHHEFFFADGLIQCDAAEGVEEVFSGPFYCYYEKASQGRLHQAFDLIYELIEDEGPFDGIFGFSQGGALASSFLLHHRKTNPYEPDPFNLAVFTCASLPFDPQCNTRADKYITLISPQSGAVSVRDWNSEDVVEPQQINGFTAPPEADDIVLRRFHPKREAARISIPTVHIMGSQDPFYPQGLVLAQLCSGHTEIVEHPLGHQIPHDVNFTRSAVAAIKKCIHRVLSQC
ncbi:Dihydrofolate reductase [Apiospora arundinis]